MKTIQRIRQYWHAPLVLLAVFALVAASPTPRKILSESFSDWIRVYGDNPYIYMDRENDTGVFYGVTWYRNYDNSVEFIAGGYGVDEDWTYWLVRGPPNGQTLAIAVDGNSNVGIKKVPAAGVELDVNGDIQASGQVYGGTWDISGDLDVMDDIAYVQSDGQIDGRAAIGTSVHGTYELDTNGTMQLEDLLEIDASGGGELVFHNSGTEIANITGASSYGVEFNLSDDGTNSPSERAVLQGHGGWQDGYGTMYYGQGDVDLAADSLLWWPSRSGGIAPYKQDFGTVLGGDRNFAGEYGTTLGGDYAVEEYEAWNVTTGKVTWPVGTGDGTFMHNSGGGRVSGSTVYPYHWGHYITEGYKASIVLTDTWQHVGVENNSGHSSYYAFEDQYDYIFIPGDDYAIFEYPMTYYFVEAELLLIDGADNEVGAYTLSGLYSCVFFSGDGGYAGFEFATPTTTTLYEDDPSWDAEMRVYPWWVDVLYDVEEPGAKGCFIRVGVKDTDSGSDDVTAIVTYRYTSISANDWSATTGSELDATAYITTTPALSPLGLDVKEE